MADSWSELIFRKLSGGVKVSQLPGVMQVPNLHTNIHKGRVLTCSRVQRVMKDADFDMVVVAGAVQYPHILMTLNVTGLVHFQLFEDVSFTGGVVTPSINHKRSSPNVADAVFYHSPTVTNPGTLLYGMILPGGEKPNNVGHVEKIDHEWILDLNKKYLFRMSNLSNDQIAASMNLTFYYVNKAADDT